MYVSCFLGPTGRGPIDDLPLIDFCIEMGIEADKAGFALVNVGEQHFNNYEPYSDPFIMGAVLGREMKQAWFGTTVVNLAFHNPIRFAEHCNIVDLLTKGKCFFGLSTGHLPFITKQFGVPDNYNKDVAFQRIEVARKAWAKKPQDPPVPWKTDLEEGVLLTRLMPIGYRKDHPVIGFATNTDSTIEQAAREGWPVALGRYNFAESVRKMAVYRDALLAAGHPAAVVERCIALSSVTKAIVMGETDEEAWAKAEAQLRGFMNFTFKVATHREVEDQRTMRALWDDTVPGNVDIAHAGFTPAEWVQASAIVGSPETVARQFRDYADAGVPHINARFVYGDFDAAEAWRNFRLFADEVLPRIGARSIPAPARTEIRDEHLGGASEDAGSLSRMFAAS